MHCRVRTAGCSINPTTLMFKSVWLKCNAAAFYIMLGPGIVGSIPGKGMLNFSTLQF
jgi:hypothetical protein